MRPAQGDKIRPALLPIPLLPTPKLSPQGNNLNNFSGANISFANQRSNETPKITQHKKSESIGVLVYSENKNLPERQYISLQSLFWQRYSLFGIQTFFWQGIIKILRFFSCLFVYLNYK